MSGRTPASEGRGPGLSDEEMAALIEGIGDGEVATGGGIAPKGAVNRHEFGIAAPQLSGELGALGILHERFARSLRRAFLPLLRYQPPVRLGRIESRAYDDYVADLRQSLVCFNIVRVDPLRGTVLVSLEPALISALVDGFFGGKGETRPRAHGDFTPTEERVIQRLVEGMCIGLARAWEDVAQLRFTFVGTESNAQLAVFLEQDDAVLVIPLEVAIGNGHTKVDILYPLQMLKPVLPALRSKVQADRIEGSSDWRERLAAALLEIPLPVRAVLAEPVVQVGKLATLASGDLLPIQAGEAIRVMVVGQEIGAGQVGEQRGLAAIRLTTLHPAAPEPAPPPHS